MLSIDAPPRFGRPLAALAALATLALATPALAESPPSPPKKEPPSTAVDIGAALGGITRVGDAPAFNITERGGPLIGASVSYVFHPIALGLAYEHARLGREESAVGAYGAVQVARQIDALWAFARVRFHGIEPLIPFFHAGASAVWQSARAVGITSFGLGSGVPFSCSVRDSINIGLRVGAGLEVPLSSSVLFLGEGSFDAYRLSSEALEGCTLGAGTTLAFTLRAGFVYRFDLTGGAWGQGRR